MDEFLYNFYTDSGDSRRSNTSSSGNSNESIRTVNELEKKVDRLMMITQALWTIVKEDKNLSDDDLKELIENIDLKDGKLDGKYKSPVVKCMKCNRTIQRGSDKCMYCGTAAEKSLF